MAERETIGERAKRLLGMGGEKPATPTEKAEKAAKYLPEPAKGAADALIKHKRDTQKAIEEAGG